MLTAIIAAVSITISHSIHFGVANVATATFGLVMMGLAVFTDIGARHAWAWRSMAYFIANHNLRGGQTSHRRPDDNWTFDAVATLPISCRRFAWPAAVKADWRHKAHQGITYHLDNKTISMTLGIIS